MDVLRAIRQKWKNGPKLGGISSMIVGIGGMLFFFSLTVVCSVFHFPVLAAFSLFLLLLALTSRLWGSLAVRRVSVSVSADSRRMFVGDKAMLRYTIRNGKRLPLIWLELLQAVPRKDCFVPEEGLFERYVLEPPEQEKLGYEENQLLKMRFSFLMGRETLCLDTEWTAQRRGIYTLKEVLLRGGDGFGLMQAEESVAVPGEPSFVVYPRLVPVDAAPFLRCQWDGHSGSRGFLDDPSVLRGQKKYEPTDSWKRINWRMAARQQELSVHLYETIMPKTAHFVLDGESFCGLSPAFDELEDVLRVLASLLIRLASAGVRCSLSLPHSVLLGPVSLDLGEGSDVSEALLLLAGYDCLAVQTSGQYAGPGKPVYAPSVFDEKATAALAAAAGRTYFLTYDAGLFLRAGAPVRLDPARLTLLTWKEPNDTERLALEGIRLMRLEDLKR
jgi:uncharacterized protein (DUF58 family)